MERFELFSTAQCYYLIASDKAGTAFRVLKFDRTLIEVPNNDNSNGNLNNANSGSANDNMNLTGGGGGDDANINFNGKNDAINEMGNTSPEKSGGVGGDGIMGQDFSNAAMDDQNNNNNQPKTRRLSEFCTEDPNVYSATEIRNMLDMIHDGNKNQNSHKSNHPHGTSEADNENDQKHGGNDSKSSGGLKPLVKAHGIVGFIRFLDCYLLTLITKKSKVGSIGGNDIYTIKSTETFPIKPAEGNNTIGNGNDPHSVLLNMWNRGKRSLNLGLTNRELAELHYQVSLNFGIRFLAKI